MIIVIDVAETKKCYVIISVLQGKAIVAGGKPQKLVGKARKDLPLDNAFANTTGVT